MATAPTPHNRPTKADQLLDPHFCRVVRKEDRLEDSDGGVRRRADVRVIGVAPHWRDRLIIVALLAFCSIVIAHGIHTGEFSFNVDETIHATTGLYFADLVRDLPLRHIVQYTYRYYGQYPALGVVHWPPLFHISEGLAFLLFGPSVVVARSTVLLFALLGIYFQFRLAQSVLNTRTAVVAAIIFGFMPATLLFEKVVMLEIPALSLGIGAMYFWTRYLQSERRRDVYWFAFLACASLLTKQTAAFLVPTVLLSALFTGRMRVLFRRSTWEAAAICAVLLTPYYLSMTRLHGHALFKSVSASRPLSLMARLGFYWHVLPSQVGWALLGISVLGLIYCVLHRRESKLLIFVAWILGCYVTFTPIGLLENRFMIYWLPAWACLAAIPLTMSLKSKPLRVLQPVAAVLVIGAQLVSAWSFQRPYVDGYGDAARSAVKMAGSGYVLFDGPLPGNFIFFVRATDPDRRVGVLRKALYATMITKEEGSEELVQGETGIRDLLAQDGVRYVVVAENTRLQFDVQRSLRDLVNTSQFRLRGRFRISGTDPEDANAYLAIYENLQAPASPSERYLHLKMLTMSHDLVVPFGTLGPPRMRWFR